MKRAWFFLKYLIFKPKALLEFQKLIKLSNTPFNEKGEEALKSFKKIFEHAYKNSQYYSNKYSQSDIAPEDIITKEDICKIPTITKEELREHLNDILTVPKDTRYIGVGSTGGSTGIPMLYYSDKRLPLEAFAWRYLDWWGLKPWDDGAFIWRMRRTGRLANLINKLAWWPVKKIRLDSSILTDEILHEFARRINKAHPPLIQGYIGSIYEFALFIEKNNIKIHSPKAIWVTSAPITVFQRNLIERVFDAPVYNEYGSSEIPWIAAQCAERKYLHVNTEGRYLEILNPDSNGVGDIVVTDLLNYAFPLIRYEIGDRSRLIDEPCSCGRSLPLIDEVKGRIGDTIIIPDLGKLDGSYLTTIFDKYPQSVLNFQIVQHENFSITIRIVPNHNYKNWKDEVELVRNKLATLTEGRISIKLETCREIPSDRGKSRYIIKET